MGVPAIYLPILSSLALYQTPAVLEPSLHQNKTPILSAQASLKNTASGGSHAYLAAPVPILPQYEGWSLNIGAGASESGNSSKYFLSPGQYFLDISAGRNIKRESTGETNTGLRGYMELGFRYRRAYGSQSNHVLQNSYDAFVRMGAAKHPDGVGLVDQGPARLSFAVTSFFYLPIRDTSSPTMGAKIFGLYANTPKFFDPGFVLDIAYSPNATKTLEYELLKRYIGFGPAIRWRIASNQSLVAELKKQVVMGKDNVHTLPSYNFQLNYYLGEF